jgi:hypothetical protein
MALAHLRKMLGSEKKVVAVVPVFFGTGPCLTKVGWAFLRFGATSYPPLFWRNVPKRLDMIFL